jgi:hypothetical protein
LGSLSKVDFDGAHLTADKFQLPEAPRDRSMSIVQSVMGTQPPGNVNRRGQNFQPF